MDEETEQLKVPEANTKNKQTTSTNTRACIPVSLEQPGRSSIQAGGEVLRDDQVKEVE